MCRAHIHIPLDGISRSAHTWPRGHFGFVKTGIWAHCNRVIADIPVMKALLTACKCAARLKIAGHVLPHWVSSNNKLKLRRNYDPNYDEFEFIKAGKNVEPRVQCGERGEILQQQNILIFIFRFWYFGTLFHRKSFGWEPMLNPCCSETKRNLN